MTITATRQLTATKRLTDQYIRQIAEIEALYGPGAALQAASDLLDQSLEIGHPIGVTDTEAEAMAGAAHAFMRGDI